MLFFNQNLFFMAKYKENFFDTQTGSKYNKYGVFIPPKGWIIV